VRMRRDKIFESGGERGGRSRSREKCDGSSHQLRCSAPLATRGK
jgi:hypothetical protein